MHHNWKWEQCDGEWETCEEGQLLFSLRPDDRRRLVVRIESKNHSGEIWEPSTNQTNIKADEQTTTGVGIAQSVRPRD